MSKKLLVGLLIGVVVVLMGISSYNGMVKVEEDVNTSWAQVQNVYQRRLDLIPNLVSTVKGYATHEEKTFLEVVEARNKATQLQLNVDNLDEASIKKFQNTQGELSGALSRLLSITENYPELKANQNFLELQAQLEGTENRIAVERKRFNETCRIYNTKIRRFPSAVFAGLFGFKTKGYFEADSSAQSAPKVEF